MREFRDTPLLPEETKRILSNAVFERMPDVDAGQCVRCGYWSLSHPEVQRILLVYEKWHPLKAGIWSAARCRCAPEMRPEIERQRRGMNVYNANLPLHRGDERGPRIFSNFTIREGTHRAWDACHQWIEGRGAPLLLLRGMTGAGKSHLAEASLRAVLEKGRSARYEHVADLLDAIKRTFGADGTESESDVVDRCIEVDFLALDDIGVEKPSAFTVDRLTRLVDHRIRNGKPLLVTTNLDMAEIASRIGARLASRLFEQSAAVNVVKLTCHDYRIKRGG